MKDQYQNNKHITGLIKRQLRNNPKRSISRLFTKLRGYRRVSYCGDLQILHLIVSTLTELKIKPDRSKLLYSYNKSPELKQNPKEAKQVDIDQLLNLNKLVEIQRSCKQNTEDNGKSDPLIVKNLSENIYG